MTHRPAIRRPILLAALAAVALPLGGCGAVNRGVESVNQPVVTRTDYAFDVQSGPGGLAPGEAQRLRGWLDALRLGYGDSVTLDDPAGAGSAARADVAAVAAHYGLLLAADAPVTGAPVAPGTLRVVVSRSRAAVPSCTDGRRNLEPAFDYNNTTDYGCAINTNLAAMVANPTDLVRGNAGGSDYDAQWGTRAITTLRAATPTGNGGGSLKGQAESTGSK
ncbi:CpaD family pilus assembly lipoprotein [Sphingomonas adhaesiva]|uniref:CpaD family pilus assembly lipoprotein n=1 Tax=Sphingomonas adhaesiva TaxID=28212 RepID=UPI002FF8B91F